MAFIKDKIIVPVSMAFIVFYYIIAASAMFSTCSLAVHIGFKL